MKTLAVRTLRALFIGIIVFAVLMIIAVILDRLTLSDIGKIIKDVAFWLALIIGVLAFLGDESLWNRFTS